jgi:hypothetical protein
MILLTLQILLSVSWGTYYAQHGEGVTLLDPRGLPQPCFRKICWRFMKRTGMCFPFGFFVWPRIELSVSGKPSRSFSSGPAALPGTSGGLSARFPTLKETFSANSHAGFR